MPVAQVIQEALDLKRLNLPESPKVIDLIVENYTDMDGEASLRITAVIDEATDLDQIEGGNVGRLKAEIHRSLQQRGIELFPYIFIAKPSELATEEQDA
ncbi:MAG: hypothetical protein R3C59_18405 [Planctomycetaceae bacterium]